MPTIENEIKEIDMIHEIIDFLEDCDSLITTRGRENFLFTAGLEKRLKKQIDLGGAPNEFIPHLVQKVANWGAMADGRDPMVAVLRTATDLAPPEKKQIGQTLIANWHQLIPPDSKTGIIELIIKDEIKDFTIERRNILIGVLASICNVEKTSVRIIEAVPVNSTKVTIEMPEEAIHRFQALSIKNRRALYSINVREMENQHIGRIEVVPPCLRILIASQNLLAKPAIQGLLALVAVIIALGAWFFPDIRSSLLSNIRPTPTNIQTSIIEATQPLPPSINPTSPCSPSITILSPQAGQQVTARLARPGIHYEFPMNIQYQICGTSEQWSILTITQTLSPKCYQFSEANVAAQSDQATILTPVLDINNLTSIEGAPLDFSLNVYLVPSNLDEQLSENAMVCQDDLINLGIDLDSLKTFPGQTLNLKLAQISSNNP